MDGYWEFIARRASRANRDTLETLGYGNIRRLPISVIVFLVALVVVREVSGATQMGDEWKWGISIIAGAIAVYIPLFLYNFIRAPDRIHKEQRAHIADLENTLYNRRVEVSGDAHPFSDDGYDLFVSVHNPTANTIRNVSASLMEIIPVFENDQREKIERLVGVPLCPEGKRGHHKPTPEHIDIHPADTRRFEIGRVHFVAPSSRSKSHMAMSIAETTPVLDGEGRTWYSHGVDRGIHFPDEGEWEIRVVVRGQDIKPEQVSFVVNFDTQTVRSGG